MTVRRPTGIETDTSCRLCVRAPRIRMEDDGEGRGRRGMKPRSLSDDGDLSDHGLAAGAPPWSGQSCFGSVPEMKTSVIRVGHDGVARNPDSGSISAVTTSDGTGKPALKNCGGSAFEKSAKIGTAACAPDRWTARLSS